MHEKKIFLALEFLFKTVFTFLFLEALLYPYRQPITEAFSEILRGKISGNYSVVWECTAIDEVLLLASALWWSGGPIRERVVSILLGAAAVWLYNVARIVILAHYPNQTLHDVLFRWGGFVIILGVYYALTRQRIKTG
ncbi:MAG TPA: exosortase/archaeosortase family protein [Euryarchaeota archaeon]|nr:exosortase/archaeosortase family protein [Euryarchaeota archaeon]